jgi:GNAT superfamily N-acetyltransferase
MQALSVVSCRGGEAEKWIPDLARLRIAVFRDYPYLYDGTAAYEEKYLRTYTDSPDALIILALDAGTVVGASTGLPMAHETDEFKRPFIAAGHDPAHIFYCGESVLLPSHRGRGVYASFFEGRERHARTLGLELCTFCGVQRPENHPLRPAGYMPLDPVWRKFGYTPRPELCTTFDWKDIDQPGETAHDMMFWTKRL